VGFFYFASMPFSFKAGVAQLGARMHYAVPAAYARDGMLNAFFTDIWFPKLPGALRYMIRRSAPALASRQHDEIPDSLVNHAPLFGFQYARSLRRAKSRSEETSAFLHYSKAFAQMAAGKFHSSDLIYGFNSAFLEIAQAHRGKKFLVLEQTLAPRRTERLLLSAIPGYPEDAFSITYEAREQAEWELADLIVCGSTFVQQALIENGVSAHKTVVIPYGVSLPSASQSPSLYDGSTPLKLLFTGNGAFRKGLPDLLEAIKSLSIPVSLTVAGNLHLPHSFALPAAQNTTYLGSVPRSRMPELYASHHVFVLPSLCEGSATVTYEALQSGLPVICTPNTGSIVTHESDGFIVPVNSPGAIANAIAALQNPVQWKIMHQNALHTGSWFSEKAYAGRLISVLSAAYRDAKG
jgi:glycosyltransferase involved in cell wall biosynthesis